MDICKFPAPKFFFNLEKTARNSVPFERERCCHSFAHVPHISERFAFAPNSPLFVFLVISCLFHYSLSIIACGQSPPLH